MALHAVKEKGINKRFPDVHAILSVPIAVILSIFGINATIALAQAPEKKQESLAEFLKEELRKNEERLTLESVQEEPVKEPPAKQPDTPPAPQTVTIDSTNNQYLKVVQEQINRHWVMPPVDEGRAMEVVITFRLHRSGTVSHVAVEKTSGHTDFDEAGTRAVNDAVPLPPFPSRMTEPYLDTQFTFRVKR